MNLSEIPTPETTFRYEADKYTGGFSAYENMRDHAIDLERRLTVAREALETVSRLPIASMYPDGPCLDRCDMEEVREAIALTASKS